MKHFSGQMVTLRESRRLNLIRYSQAETVHGKIVSSLGQGKG